MYSSSVGTFVDQSASTGISSSSASGTTSYTSFSTESSTASVSNSEALTWTADSTAVSINWGGSTSASDSGTVTASGTSASVSTSSTTFVDHAPTAAGATLTVIAGAVGEVALRPLVADPDTGDTLILSSLTDDTASNLPQFARQAATGSQGTAYINENGELVYTARVGTSGTDWVDYQVMDQYGLIGAASVKIVITLPTVTIAATDPNASEVGPDPGSFTITRTGPTSGPLLVTYGINGRATNGVDYNLISNVVTIPAGAPSVVVTIIPITDTVVEGIQDVTFEIRDNDRFQTINGIMSATVNIRDRAAVKTIMATSGVTRIPAGGGGRNVTGATLTLTQDDTVSFKAIPTDGGDFAPGEPVWNVTALPPQSGTTMTVKFDYFRYGQTVSVATPAHSYDLSSGIVIVPYPTAIISTAVYLDGPLPRNKLPMQYGTAFQHTLSASAGATPADLELFASRGLLRLWEYVTTEPAAVYNEPVISAPFKFHGTGTGVLVDGIDTGIDLVFPLSPTGVPISNAAYSTPQDFLWGSTALDSLTRIRANYSNDSTNWHPWATVPIVVSLATNANGWTVTTTDNAVPFVQPYSPGASYATLVLSAGNIIPFAGTGVTPPGTLTVNLAGSVKLTAADIAAGTKSFTITMYDYDLFSFSDPLQTITVTVPTTNGVAGMFTSFRVAATLSNIDHIVSGALGSSGERVAQVYFVITADDTEVTSVYWVTAQ